MCLGLRLGALGPCLVWLLCAFPLCSGALELPVKAPAGSQSGVVADNITHNGLTQSIVAFQWERSVAATAEYYRQQLKSGYKEQTVNGRLLFSKPYGAKMLVVELVGQANFTRGVISLADYARRPIQADLSFMPKGSRLMMDSQSADNGQQARYVVYSNNLSVDNNYTQLSASFLAQGFKLEQSASSERADGLVAVFKTATQSVQASMLSKADKVVVTLIWQQALQTK